MRLLTLALAVLTGAAPAQEGRDRGPGDLVPKPGEEARGPGARVVLQADLSVWEFWWAFERDGLLPPATPAAARIDAKVVAGRIVPALRRALAEEDAGIQAAAILALAKAARRVDGEALRRLIVPHLASRHQRVRESAALALGIAGLPTAIPDLAALALDDADGRRLSGGAAVSPRTRAFACYGLGFLAERSSDHAVRRRVWKALHWTLHGIDSVADPARAEVAVAGIQAMSLLRPETLAHPGARQSLRDQILDSLELWRKRGARPDALVQAQLAPAIARVLGRGDSERHTRFKDRCLEQIQGTVSVQLLRSAVIGLGRTALPPEDREGEGRYSEALRKTAKRCADAQSTSFAMIALGRIGGAGNREALVERLQNGRKVLDRPWAALALGVLETRRLRAPRAGPDAALGTLLLKQIKENKAPSSRAAIALALALCGYRPAVPALRDMLLNYRSQDQLAGELCTALSLLGDPDPGTPVIRVTSEAVRRPHLLRNAAPALMRLTAGRESPTLVRMLSDGQPSLAVTAALAEGIGASDDPEVVDALIALAKERETPPQVRALVISALGMLADPARTPFHATLSQGLNYRAIVPTLVYRGTGLLEIL